MSEFENTIVPLPPQPEREKKDEEEAEHVDVTTILISAFKR
jgi:hypothetical protein